VPPVRRTIFAIAVLVTLVVAIGLFYRQYLATPAGDEAWVRIELPEGIDAADVALMLSRNGLVEHPRALALYARIMGKDRELQAGSYLLSRSMTPLEILERLVEGQVVTVEFTVPEGATMRTIASIVQTMAGVDSMQFMNHCTSDSFSQSLGVTAGNLEGYLFPDTYTITWGARADRVAAMMVARLMALLTNMEWDEELTQLSRHEILTLASIVEKEAQVPRERTMIAAVYLNRLRLGMKLDADPTVAYALGGGPRRLTYDDLSTPSPYNTYLNPGLPPGPICSPGLGCINAVVHPDRACKALYFVAAGDGSHVFSRTYAEHLRAVRRYRASRHP
jgi:UPF0755 protein